MDDRLPRTLGSQRTFWWAVTLLVGSVLGIVVIAFIGTFSLAFFVYYGSRPIYRRIHEHVDSRDVAGALTLLIVVIPILALLGLMGFQMYREVTNTTGPNVLRTLFNSIPGIQGSLQNAVQRPARFYEQLQNISVVNDPTTAALNAIMTVSEALLKIGLALTIAFFLFRDGHRVREWFDAEFGDEAATVEAYATALDSDFEAVFYGNVLTVLLVCALSVVVYNGFNFFSPPNLSIPLPTLLALLTGLATLVPILVGKVVYIPITLYLLWRSFHTAASDLWFPLLFLVVAFLILDILPDTVFRAYFSGRTMHKGLVLFAYTIGVPVFGWYGLFFGPILLVVTIQLINIVIPDLFLGRRISPTSTGAMHQGSNPSDFLGEGSETASDGGDTADGSDATEGRGTDGERHAADGSDSSKESDTADRNQSSRL